MDLDVILVLVQSSVRLAIPLIFAAMAGVFCERSGVINICLEGKMLTGAFAAATVAHITGSAVWGVFGALACGLIMAAIYGLSVLVLKANQIVAGTAVNMFAFGVTPIICKLCFDSTGNTPQLMQAERFGPPTVVVAVLLVILSDHIFRRTRFGLWIRFAGENPTALACAGVNPVNVRWAAVLVSGALASFGGATLSMYLSSGFTREMSAGRGFIALAALIFGRWTPFGAFGACLLFGLMDAAQIRLQSVKWGGLFVPVQLIQVLPYLVTIVVLAAFGRGYSAPKALGK